MNAESREAEVVGFLEELPWNQGPLIIGGYAVSAYGPPRFSVDVDIVLPAGSLEFMEDWLKREGFRSRMTLGSRQTPMAPCKLKVEKGMVTGDLYFGGLRARDTGAEVSYAWLALDPRERVLRLRTVSTRHPVGIVRPEALWLLKLIAGRTQDLSDLFSIRGEPIDVLAISQTVAGFASPTRDAISRRVYRLLESEKVYRDALSRWELGSPSSGRNRANWARFRDRVRSILRHTGTV